jgi:hypothetical protein
MQRVFVFFTFHCGEISLSLLEYSANTYLADFLMNNVPRQTLRQIIDKYGQDLCSDARRCEGLLKDLCGSYRREINVLVNALEERVPLDLLAAGSSMPRELLLGKLTRRLEDNLGLTPEAALWAVDSWALALGILTDAEVSQKEMRQINSAQPIPPVKPTQTTPQSPKIQPPIQNRQPQIKPRPTQTPPRPQPPKVYPPVIQPPQNAPVPTKNPSGKSGSPTAAQSQNSLQSNTSAVTDLVPKRGCRRFFSCFFILILLALIGTILFFGVPYAINVMRETQQQSEPPRFPPQ